MPEVPSTNGCSPSPGSSSIRGERRPPAGWVWTDLECIDGGVVARDTRRICGSEADWTRAWTGTGGSVHWAGCGSPATTKETTKPSPGDARWISRSRGVSAPARSPWPATCRGRPPRERISAGPRAGRRYDTLRASAATGTCRFVRARHGLRKRTCRSARASADSLPSGPHAGGRRAMSSAPPEHPVPVPGGHGRSPISLGSPARHRWAASPARRSAAGRAPTGAGCRNPMDGLPRGCSPARRRYILWFVHLFREDDRR